MPVARSTGVASRWSPRSDAAVSPRQAPSVMEEVCRSLLGAILDGTHPPGARLPSERELSAGLGASRVAVREALRRLQEWRIVECRRGSGTTVLPRRHWTGMALGASLAQALSGGEPEGGVGLVQDGLALRRSLLVEMIERGAPRLAGRCLDRPRELVRRAWAQRADLVAFLQEDREVIPLLLEEAGLYASLWTLNSLADPYLKTMEVLLGRFTVPASYLPAMNTMIAALEIGDGVEAHRALGRFLDDLDESVRASLPAALKRRLRR